MMRTKPTKRQQQIDDFQSKIKRARNNQQIVDYCNERLGELKIEKFQIIDMRRQAEYQIANPNEQVDTATAWDVKDPATRQFLLRWL